MTTLLRYSKKFDSSNQHKSHDVYKTALLVHTIHRTTPAPGPHQSTLRPLCHLYSAKLPPQGLVKLQFRDRLRCHPASCNLWTCL